MQIIMVSLLKLQVKISPTKVFFSGILQFWGGGGNYSDLALVEVHYAFQWTTAMKPACLPFSVDYWDTKSLVTP